MGDGIFQGQIFFSRNQFTFLCRGIIFFSNNIIFNSKKKSYFRLYLPTPTGHIYIFFNFSELSIKLLFFFGGGREKTCPPFQLNWSVLNSGNVDIFVLFHRTHFNMNCIQYNRSCPYLRTWCFQRGSQYHTFSVTHIDTLLLLSNLRPQFSNIGFKEIARRPTNQRQIINVHRQ